MLSKLGRRFGEKRSEDTGGRSTAQASNRIVTIPPSRVHGKGTSLGGNGPQRFASPCGNTFGE